MNFTPLTLEELQHPQVAVVPRFNLTTASSITDQLLLQIPDLAWVPWVGDRYLELMSEKRILVIGESHYYEETEGSHSLNKHRINGYTRLAVQKFAIEREYKANGNSAAKLYPNFHRTLFGTDDFDSKLFWENVCYYNFIQEPMNTKNGRPSKHQFQLGWKVFSDVVNVLRPSYCIFLGNSSAKYFPSTLASDITIFHSISDDGWLNRTASRKVTLELKDGHKINLKFIRHPSNHYSWSKWNEHLKSKYPDLMIWLDSLI